MGYLTDLARLRLARCSCPAAKHATSPSLPAGRGGNAPAASQTATVSKLLVERLPWLGGRRLAVLWDLENVGIFSPQATVPIQVHRLRALLTAQGAALERFVAVASGQRVQRLRHAGGFAQLPYPRGGLLGAPPRPVYRPLDTQRAGRGALLAD